ncbi:MAG: autotransporter outer membrane beta-barrel domain-containing protein [Selenomonadaceae bacterium]|nr:autotransporter outer membrane beta-barrel domain-containing protein [Selenomonadaceae bacterium]
METISKKDFGTRRCLFAVAIFFGMSVTTCQAAGSETEDITSEIIEGVKEDTAIESEDKNKNFGNGSRISERRNVITQRENILLTEDGATGILVDGFGNRIAIPKGIIIQSDGAGGKGILISYGSGHNLNVGGEISAAGNAVEFNFSSDTFNGEYRGSYLRYLRGVGEGTFTITNLPIVMNDGEFLYSANELNGALVENFNLSGKIAGNRAIYIGKNSFVKNINVNKGAEISGDIVSDWKNFTEKQIGIQYDDKIIDATKYIPDLVTNLNINTDLEYGGRISGADNMKIHVKTGVFNFSGTADVVSVDVMRGAKIFGGTFNLSSPEIADGFSDSTAGKFINHGTIAAGSPDTNLIINGDLISDGVIQKVSGGSAGLIIVNGNANIEGSIVTTDSLLPNETATVLSANSITGNIKNPEGNPVPISAMLSATGKIVDNTLQVTTHQADNTNEMDLQTVETFDAMNDMFENLKGNVQQKEMRELYNMEPPTAKRTLTQIGSNDSAQIMSVAQQNTAIDRMISDRVGKVFSFDYFITEIVPEIASDIIPNYIDVNISPMNFADGESNSPEMKIKVKTPSRQENNFWINYMKNWGSLRGGTDYHGSVIVGGYDRPFGKKVRAGIFATYGTIGYGAESSRATVYDTRLGLYAGWHNKASDVYFYVNGGQLRNSLHRGISSLGLATNADYKSRIVEFGGEYKYDLSPKKIWHVSPFINFQASHLRQNSYNERGAGIYNHHVDAASNTYFAAQTGVDLKRYYHNGMFGMRFGIKRGFTGADPDLKIRYEGNDAESYSMRYQRDKIHFLCSVRGESEFARGWFMGGEAELQVGENDKDVTASVMLRRIW